MNSFILIPFIVMAILVGSIASHGDQETGEKKNHILLLKDKLIADTASGVFDWVFGDPDDAAMHNHDIDEHFMYLKNPDSLSNLADAAGIKPEFLNFKAHDYDNNDKIDGLELMALILNEKVGGHHDQVQQTLDQQMELGSKIIDRLLDEEDLNRDGFLDFNEYSSARARLAGTKV